MKITLSTHQKSLVIVTLIVALGGLAGGWLIMVTTKPQTTPTPAPVPTTLSPQPSPVAVESLLAPAVSPRALAETTQVPSPIQTTRPVPTPTVAPSPAPSAVIYVAPQGMPGLHENPPPKIVRTIQAALDAARPGTTIIVQPGTYREHLVTQHDGTKTSPIILQAQGRVVLRGSDTARIFDVFHDHYRIEGFEFDGGYNETKQVDRTVDKLLWLETANFTTVRRNYFHHAQGECVRILFFSSTNTLTHNTIMNCGLRDFVASRGASFTNGEGVYIGVAPEQLDAAKCKSAECRARLAKHNLKTGGRETGTANNVITYNLIDTHGNECVDIKEGSTGNLVSDNTCLSQYDPNSAAFATRARRTTFQYNAVGPLTTIPPGDHTSSVRGSGHTIAGAAFRMGGDASGEASQATISHNLIVQAAVTTSDLIKFSPDNRPATVCGNTIKKTATSQPGKLAQDEIGCPTGTSLTPSGPRGCVGHQC